MPYNKTKWGGERAIPAMPAAALNNIEDALELGYHVLTVGACAQMMEIFGDVVAFWPFFENARNRAQDFGPNGYHLYTDIGAAEDLDAWDTAPELQGVMRAYVFNGTDEYLMALDQDLFTVVATNAFSMGMWVKMTTAADNCFLSKWDETNLAEAREWLFCTDNTGYITMILYDETNTAQIGREYQTALGTEGWHYIVGVYDGGTDAANIAIYLDGLKVDDADVADDAGFASMVNQATPVRCGSYEDAAGDEEYLFDGRGWGPFFTRKELSADEVWNLYQLGRAVLHLPLSAGMP
ncbi:MAG TPA: LamG-like jellyroll fold domain-containing protein [Anaerolineae bacterium]|nr:LamG-like jellyroll fold domain-containing protein [Anaerolineae bacterium]